MNKKKNIPEQGQYVKLKKINIDKFRRFHNVELLFGKKVTLICGRNCTSKSTALAAARLTGPAGYRTAKRAPSAVEILHLGVAARNHSTVEAGIGALSGNPA